MTGQLLEPAGVFIGYIAGFVSCYAIQIYPMWETRGLTTRTVFAFIACLTVVQSAGLFLLFRFTDFDLSTISAYKLISALPSMIFPFFIFRKRTLQSIFLLSIHLIYNITPIGISNYAYDYWFSSFAYPMLTANILLIAITAITLPFVVYVLRRMFQNTYIGSAGMFWRYFWLIPVLFFAIILLSDNYLIFSLGRDISFVAMRLLTLAVLMFVCYLLDASLRQVSENIELKEHARTAEKQLDMHREQYERITQNAEASRNLRHDLRHHFTAVSRLAEDESAERTKAYLDELSDQVVFGQEKTYCKNHAANAVAAHYLGIAESEGVKVEAALRVPEDTNDVPAMDICVILGNFLENALEACRRMEQGDRFISVRSRIDGDTLSIVVTNSYDGVWREENGVYLSRKKQGKTSREGVGLSSVRAVCEKHRGFAQYEITTDVWKSCALVHMGGK